MTKAAKSSGGGQSGGGDDWGNASKERPAAAQATQGAQQGRGQARPAQAVTPPSDKW